MHGFLWSLPHWQRLSFGRAERGAKRNWAMGACLLAGVALGSFCLAGTGEQSPYFSYFAQQYLNLYQATSFYDLFAASFFAPLLLQSALLFCAASCFGGPVAALLLVFRGIGFGGVSAYLYQLWGLRGMAANLVMFLLPALIQCLLHWWMAGVAWRSSASLFRLHCRAQAGNLPTSVQEPLRVYLFSSAGLLIAAALQAGLSLLFSVVFF